MTWNLIDDYTGDRYVKFKGESFDMDQLKMDQHFFTVTTENPKMALKDIFLYTLHKDCVACPYQFYDYSTHNISKNYYKYRLATEYKEYYPPEHTGAVICDLEQNFGQFGVYNLRVDNSTSCTVEVLKEPVNIYFPILTVFILHILVFGGLYFLLKFWNKFQARKESQSNNHNDTSAPKKERVMSIDAFRGISIVIMIFANFGCGGYDFVEHSVWNGLHVADLVFPWFMWIMGTCIPISLMSSFKRNVSNKDLLWNVLKRSIKLFLIGVFLNSGDNVYYLRVMGVLQRFGLCYFFVTTICIFTMDRNMDEKHEVSKLKYIADILKVWKGWIICLIVVIFHTILIFLVAAPGCQRGYMGPGGLHENRSHEHCIGGATGYIDGLILGNLRYQKPTIYHVFESRPFDPEGLLGCLTSIFHVMFGVQAGITLLVFKKPSERIIRWLTWSVFLGILGGGLSGFSKEDGLIPVNKNLWSMSFVFVTCCFAFFLLSVCYFLMDVKKWWSGKPMLFAGMNAIILYIGHSMTQGYFPVSWYYSETLGDSERRTHFIALLSHTWAADIWVLISYYLYKINYFFTV